MIIYLFIYLKKKIISFKDFKGRILFYVLNYVLIQK
jgi:hypothetical protein